MERREFIKTTLGSIFFGSLGCSLNTATSYGKQKDKRVADKDGALYNLINDPDERENLYGKPKYKNIVKYLEGLADDWDRKI